MDMPESLQSSIVEVLQKDNTIVFVMGHNGQYLSLLGGSNRALYSDGSVLIGKSYKDVLKQDKAEYFQSLLNKVVESNTPMEVEYELSSGDFLEKLKDGPHTIQKFRGNLFPLEIDPDEKLHKVVWVVQNISER